MHPSGLFGCHVGERASDHLRRRGGLALAWQPGRDAEAGQPDVARRGVHEDVGRLDVFVHEAVRVEPSERHRQADSDAQERRHLPGLSDEPRQHLAARVGEDERRPPLVPHQREGARGPSGLQRLTQGIGVCQPLEALRRGLGEDRGHDQERGQRRLPHAARQDEFPFRPERLEHVV